MNGQHESGDGVRYPKHRPAARQVAAALAVATAVVGLTPSLASAQESELIAHEVVHTVQQNHSEAGALRIRRNRRNRNVAR